MIRKFYLSKRVRLQNILMMILVVGVSFFCLFVVDIELTIEAFKTYPPIHLAWVIPFLSVMTFLLKRDFLVFSIENKQIVYIQNLLATGNDFYNRRQGVLFGMFPYFYLFPRFLTKIFYSEIIDFKVIDCKIPTFKKNPDIAYKKMILKLKTAEEIHLDLSFFSPKEVEEIERILRDKI